ncbi:MAG: response regulator [Limisphaerales bacterium]
MKKILLIEDDLLISNIYRNKLAVEGYQVEATNEGEKGIELVRSFRPDMVLLDLVLPKISGVEVIKQIRAIPEFATLPLIVFSNIYLTNMVQEASRAGATKCLSKSNCTPKDVLDIVRSTIGDSGAIPQAPSPTAKLATTAGNEADAAFQAELRKAFIESLPATLATLRAGLPGIIKADNEPARLQHIHELYRRIHALAGNAGLAGLTHISRMAGALEALLREIHEKPQSITTSTVRTIATTIDFLAFLFEHGIAPEKQEIPAVNILVVDDEPISRRAVVYALDKAHLHSVNLEDPVVALKLLTENNFDLVFLDVDMPGMTGYELCTKLRALPQHKKTPVVFVTALSDFDNRASSMMAGGNDFIGKPFLFIELTVKALIHVLRGKLSPSK